MASKLKLRFYLKKWKEFENCWTKDKLDKTALIWLLKGLRFYRFNIVTVHFCCFFYQLNPSIVAHITECPFLPLLLHFSFSFILLLTFLWVFEDFINKRNILRPCIWLHIVNKKKERETWNVIRYTEANIL